MALKGHGRKKDNLFDHHNESIQPGLFVSLASKLNILMSV